MADSVSPLMSGAKTPSVGWKVHGMTYLMEGWKSPANIFLAEGESPSERSISFWIGFCEPTPYHGYWKEMEGGGLYLHFNGRGPGAWPDGTERRLYGVYVHQSAAHKNRDVKLEHYGTWTVADGGTFICTSALKRRRAEDG